MRSAPVAFLPVRSLPPRRGWQDRPVTENEAGPRPSAGVLALITLRFLLELALWTSFTVSLVRLVGGPFGWIAGLLLSGLVITIWAVLLSPRRPVRRAVGVRVVIELTLFVLAAVLLWVAGLALAGAILLVVESLVLGLLGGPDKHAL
jgi:Protein of unknown function (DUF2568)